MLTTIKRAGFAFIGFCFPVLAQGGCESCGAEECCCVQVLQTFPDLKNFMKIMYEKENFELVAYLFELILSEPDTAQTLNEAINGRTINHFVMKKIIRISKFTGEASW